MRHTLATASMALAFAALPALGSSAGKEVTKTLPLAADGILTLRTYKGTIRISAGSGTQAEIVARVVPDGDDEDQRRKVEETQVRIEGGGASVEVESDYEAVKSHHGWFFGWGENGTLPFVNYEIKLPATARLKIKDYKSDIRVHDISGDFSLETYKGGAKVQGLAGKVDVETYKGDVDLELVSVSKDVRLETYKGRIEMSMPKDSRFDLDADLDRRGDLSSDFETTSTAKSHDRERMRGAVNGGGARVKFSTHKGSLRLKAR